MHPSLAGHAAHASPTGTSIYTVKDGDYLIYYANMTGMIIEGYMIFIGITAPEQRTQPVRSALRLDFHKALPTSEEYEVTLSFALAGVGYYMLTQEAVEFDYSWRLTLLGNIHTNLYYYSNGSEWGYLPFFLPQQDLSGDINISGSTQFPNELAVARTESDTSTPITTPFGAQDTFYFSVENRPTIHGVPYHGKSYNIDKDTHILLRANGDDPFWAVFSREFMLTVFGHLTLEETNIDIGPTYSSPFEQTLSGLAPLIILVIPIAGITGFLLVKNQRRSKKQGSFK